MWTRILLITLLLSSVILAEAAKSKQPSKSPTGQKKQSPPLKKAEPKAKAKSASTKIDLAVRTVSWAGVNCLKTPCGQTGQATKKDQAKLSQVLEQQIGSKRQIAEWIAVQESSFVVKCEQINKKNVAVEISLCVVDKAGSADERDYLGTQCTGELLQKQCKQPFTLLGYNPKDTHQARHKALWTNYLLTSQQKGRKAKEPLAPAASTQAAKEAAKETKTAGTTPQQKASGKRAAAAKVAEKQQKKAGTEAKGTKPAATQAQCGQKPCKHKAYKSKQVRGTISLGWLLGKCYELNINNKQDQCQWEQVAFWDQQSFLVEGFQTFPPTKANKKDIITLNNIFSQKQFDSHSILGDALSKQLSSVWPQSVVQGQEAWEQAWKEDGVDYLLALKQVLPHLFKVDNQTCFKLYQRSYFEEAVGFYKSLKKLQKVPRNSYSLDQLAKHLGISKKSIAISCASTKKSRTDALTQLKICVTLFSKDNQTISLKPSDCKAKRRFEGCRLGKEKQADLLFWANSNSSFPFDKIQQPETTVTQAAAAPEQEAPAAQPKNAQTHSTQQSTEDANKVQQQSDEEDESSKTQTPQAKPSQAQNAGQTTQNAAASEEQEEAGAINSENSVQSAEQSDQEAAKEQASKSQAEAEPQPGTQL